MSREYGKLQAFQSADLFALEIYKATQAFPKSEMYGLTSQLRRAAVSVPTNIVEGSHRRSTTDYLHFLTIALGSLAETGYLISLAQRLGYLEPAVADALSTQQTTSIKILQGLISSLREPKPKAQSLKPKA